MPILTARSVANNKDGIGRCGGSAFDRQHEGAKQNGQHGGHPPVLKQPHEPGKGGEDEEQLVEGQGKQRHGQPLSWIGRVISRHFEPQHRVKEQVKRGGDGDSSHGYGDERCVFQLEGKDRPMGVERMPRKDKAPQDDAAKENDGLQIPDWGGAVQPKRQAGITRQGRDQRGDAGQFQDPGLGEVAHDCYLDQDMSFPVRGAQRTARPTSRISY